MTSDTIPTGLVTAVALSAGHNFSKTLCPEIRLVPGHGVEGDAHAGRTVKHRSRVMMDPTQPNLRQIHLIQSELFAELATAGFTVAPGELGENVTTTGIDLLSLPTGSLIDFDGGARIALTGLRQPCFQIDGFQDGLLGQVAIPQADGTILRKAGVMAVVLQGGPIAPGDSFRVTLPAFERPLEPV